MTQLLASDSSRWTPVISGVARRHRLATLAVLAFVCLSCGGELLLPTSSENDASASHSGTTSGSGSGTSSGAGSGSSSGSSSGGSSGSSSGSNSGSSSGSGSGSSSGSSSADAGLDAQPGDEDAGIADASVDDASEAGTDAGAWIDMSSNPAACVNEPNVPCGWAPTNYGLGYTCACREGTWEDGWTCDLPDAAVFPGPTCPADGGP
jgi:hypothetical protein